MTEQVTRPRIGITCSPLRVAGYYDAYLRAIESAGGTPVVIAPLPVQPGVDDAARILSGVDGLVVPGGWDIAPPEDGGSRVTEMTQLDRALDLTEAALVRGAAGIGMPVLGICRGQQLINVALGGSLHQHIDGHDEAGRHGHELAHAVNVDPDSELGSVAPATMMVNSLHHQAVSVLAPGLRATAHSPDGVIEALESTDGTMVAVQSHPEELIDSQSWARALFARFVERSAARGAVRRRDGRSLPVVG